MNKFLLKTPASQQNARAAAAAFNQFYAAGLLSGAELVEGTA